jgi:hypothetical protein
MESVWQKCFSKTYQKDYWFNNSTGEKSWTAPMAPTTSTTTSSTPESSTPSVAAKRKHEEDSSTHAKSFKYAVRVAIIIPFQDAHKEQNRRAQLDKFIPYMTEYLKSSSADFEIIVAEQFVDDKKFNRGALLNIGFDIAAKHGCNVFILHDVDLLPSKELLEYYTSVPASPCHIARVWDRYNSNAKYFGGIVAFTEAHFRLINGFPNDFWGWGGEDDALIDRVRSVKLDVSFPTQGDITDLENLDLDDKLQLLREHSEWKCADKWEKVKENKTNWKVNGLSNLKYEIIDTVVLGSHCTKYTVAL